MLRDADCGFVHTGFEQLSHRLNDQVLGGAYQIDLMEEALKHSLDYARWAACMARGLAGYSSAIQEVDASIGDAVRLYEAELGAGAS